MIRLRARDSGRFGVERYILAERSSWREKFRSCRKTRWLFKDTCKDRVIGSRVRSVRPELVILKLVGGFTDQASGHGANFLARGSHQGSLAQSIEDARES